MNQDNCCSICRSQFGVCLTGYRCDHHAAARRSEDADDRARQTVRRPTEDQAIYNVMRSNRRRND